VEPVGCASWANPSDHDATIWKGTYDAPFMPAEKEETQVDAKRRWDSWDSSGGRRAIPE